MQNVITKEEASTIELLNKSEIDQQIATAKQYPRSIQTFLKETRELVTMTEEMAEDCMYALPRKDKDGKPVIIEGPSVRFAEIIFSQWGNSRSGARIIDEGREHITAQGVFFDLEKNISITTEVRRRITYKNGNRYNADMIGTTANAACSIALRNAITRGIPKTYWSGLYEAARQKAIGDQTTLMNKRKDALAFLQKHGATESMILNRFGLKTVNDITLDHLAKLRGLASSIKSGELTVEQAFTEAPEAEQNDAAAEVAEKMKGAK